MTGLSASSEGETIIGCKTTARM